MKTDELETESNSPSISTLTETFWDNYFPIIMSG